MASISCSEAAQALLAQALAHEPLDSERVRFLASHDCSEALFRILAEGLGDRFDRKLCDDYVSIFSRVIAEASPQLSVEELRARYERVRQTRLSTMEPARVVVLSRVTLGADIAITSVLLESAKRRFPTAEVYLAGDAKAAELFAGDPSIRRLDAPYPRNGTVLECMGVAQKLATHLADRQMLVIDPDSRLTQLGLLPICDESRYLFFESRAYGGDSNMSLGELARCWVEETFEIEAPPARISPPAEPINLRHPAVAVSLGVGGNEAKRLPEPFESDLLHLLSERFADVIVDRGFGAAETERVDRLAARAHVRTWTGSFARFTSVVDQCDSYLGYDSAGQHAAATLGKPLVTLFKGFASDRMFARWQPTGPGPKKVLKIEGPLSITDVAEALSFSFRKS